MFHEAVVFNLMLNSTDAHDELCSRECYVMSCKLVQAQLLHSSAGSSEVGVASKAAPQLSSCIFAPLHLRVDSLILMLFPRMTLPQANLLQTVLRE